MIRIAPRRRTQYATEDTEYLLLKFLDFYNLCHLCIWCDSVELKNVGPASYDLRKILPDISLALSKFQMVLKHSGKKVTRPRQRI